MKTLTGADHFCGMGGWTQAASHVGIDVLYGLNHWPIAIKTYEANHKVTALATDIESADPAQVPGSDILCTSPVCTGYTNSLGEAFSDRLQPALWEEYRDAWYRQLRYAQMRALIHQVPRFAAYHHYSLVFFENVTDLGKDWEFPGLIDAMCGNPDKQIKGLGYKVRQLCLNSMFFGAATSRDRAYLVFVREDLPLPERDLTPQAYCSQCRMNVATWQDWGKQQGRRWKWGDYGAQYRYRCIRCRGEVFPPLRAASEILDFNLPMETVKQSRIRSEKQKANIARGIQKFGGRPFVRTYNGNAILTPLDRPLPTIVTHARLALAVPQGPRVEDCLHRMVSARELLHAMTFSPAYQLYGTLADQIMMIGNAVTPAPVARIMEHYLAPLVA